MNTETLVKTPPGRLFAKVLAAGMESRFRYKFFSPSKILSYTDIKPGQTALEIGCGTGFFTIPAAQIIGAKGKLTSIDILQESVDIVTKKVQSANLENVTVKKADASDTKLGSGEFDTILLFGVIPAPMLPLKKLMPEMYRLLKPAGTLAVWPHVPGWLPHSILDTGMFTLENRHTRVYNFRKR
jgi:ubiquinone/menaquinone biosynthesis C-methylase UbiE